MAEPLKSLETEALKLTEKDRAELARVLLLSLDGSEDQDAEMMWAEEAERRYRQVTAGDVEAIPSTTVLQEARSRLK